MLPLSTLIVLPSLALASSSLADTPTLELIPNAGSAMDMSPDGRFVVGNTLTHEPYIWDTVLDVMTILPPPGINAVAVSDDGTIVLGNIPDPEGIGTQVAAIINVGEPEWQSLGYLPNALGCPSRSSAYELSADGSVAVGLSWDGCDAVAFRWTAASGMEALQHLANGGNRASVISGDGALIAGFAQGSFSRTPAMWDDTLAGVLLDPPDGDAHGEVRGMSDDGSILLANWNEDAVKWTADGGVEIIGNGQIIPGWVGNPMDIADNGTIVGFDIIMLSRRAWIQPQGEGLQRDLLAYLQVNGSTIPPELSTGLEVAQAVSRDGRFIIGHGFGNAWRITMASCPADLNDDGNVDVFDLLQLLTNWGNCSGICTSDLNDDATVDVLDLLELLTAWGACN